MKLAIVTPYYRESLDELMTAHQSVIWQDTDVTHIMVADGHPNPAIENWSCQHIVLPEAHRDAGNFARGIGALHAFQRGAEYVCFLDADNWLERNHFSSLHTILKFSGADLAVCRRSLRRLDSSVLDPFDPESDGIRFADTGTVMLSRSAIEIAALWSTMPAELGGIGDQIVWAAINNRGFKIARTELPTLNYKTKWAVHYLGRGETAPAGAVDLEIVKSSEHNWGALADEHKRRLILGRA